MKTFPPLQSLPSAMTLTARRPPRRLLPHRPRPLLRRRAARVRLPLRLPHRTETAMETAARTETTVTVATETATQPQLPLQLQHRPRAPRRHLRRLRFLSA